MFKLPGIEFLQEEFDALAAEVGKLAHEVEFEIVDHVKNGVPGRLLRRVEHALGLQVDEPVAPETPAPTAEHKDTYQ